MLKEKEYVRLKIKKGSVKITDWDFAFYLKRHNDIALICIDCSTKHYDVDIELDGANQSKLVLRANNESLRLNPDVDRNVPTEVYFEDHLDWEIKPLSEAARYCIEVCLVKKDD